MGGVASALGRRAFQALLVALMVGVITFLLIQSLPGDMAYRIAAGRYGYDQVDGMAAAAVRAELGLDRSAALMLGDWLWAVIRFDLGTSFVSGEPVTVEIAHQLGHSLWLALGAVALSLLIGPPIGILAGLQPGGWLDRLSLVAAIALRAMPAVVLGVVLILVFARGLRWLPAAGHGSMAHGLLPALTLTLGLAAVSGRVARDAMAGVRASAFYGFARTKGLPGGVLFRRHGLRNVLIPLVAYLGVQLAYLIEGVVVVESLFAWPGIGHALVHAIFSRDVPMIQGAALVMGLMFVALNMLLDLLCAAVDPRRHST